MNVVTRQMIEMIIHQEHRIIMLVQVHDISLHLHTTVRGSVHMNVCTVMPESMIAQWMIVTCPQPHEQLLMGWIAGGMTTTTQHHATMTTTCPQPREQLLVGWNAGGTTITMTQGNNDTPPTSSLTSNCSWGGLWVER
jgi:hypothetical protein